MTAATAPPVPEFSPEKIFSNHVDAGPELEVDTLLTDSATPETLPETELEYTKILGGRLLEYARSKHGHHEDVRRAMEEWVPSRSEEGSDSYRRATYSLTPSERNGSQLTGDDDEIQRKFEAIVAWIRDEFGPDAVVNIVDRYHADIAEDWESTLEGYRHKKRGLQFLSSHPNSINGWERIPAPGFTLAYYGIAKTVQEPRVVALFEMDGYVRLWQIRPEDWATDLRYRTGLDQDGVHDFRDRGLGKPGPHSWPDGAAKLKAHLESHPGDSVFKPYLPTLDAGDIGGRDGNSGDIDPTAVTPPGDWSLDAHSTASPDADVQSRRVSWQHPFYGRLVCRGVSHSWGSTNQPFRSQVRLKSGVKPDADPLVEHICWEGAVDAAIEFMDTTPDPDKAVAEAAAGIAESLNAATDDDSTLTWSEAEQQAAMTVRELADDGYDSETILTAVRAGNAAGGTGESNLPTHQPLVHAGVQHPDMSKRARRQANANATKEIGDIEQAYQAGLHSYND